MAITSYSRLFFQFLHYLQDEKRDFAIIFRTFGDDFAEVAEEVNLFCEGKHPVYPKARCDGSVGTLDLRIDIETQGHCFHRSQEGPTLALGTVKTVPAGSKQSVAEFYAADKKVRLVQGFSAVYKTLNQLSFPSQGNGRRALMVRDYFPYWHQQNESANSGKLLVVSRELETSLISGKSLEGALVKEPVQIFFDDNIEGDEPHIVDVRYMEDGGEVGWYWSQGRYLFKVEPYAAILDPNYFIKQLQRVEELWANAEP
eukprot:gb/GEZN01008104.1/.p1 GENE.gb/GEZN01008104.1/~~gb/GEZN01008104.1/.p1  ORF type:complete len:257 (-),score=37.99 gb/GEZN01008104.1/:61-831(-)